MALRHQHPDPSSAVGEAAGAVVLESHPRARVMAMVRRHGPPAAMTGMALSLLIHIIGGIIAALVSFGMAQAGGAGSGTVELAVMTEGELAVMQEAALEAEAAPAADLEPSDLTVDVALDFGETSPGLGADLGEISTAAGGGDIGTDALGVEGGGGGGAASFFGVEARGTRFAYIVDVSGSMSPIGSDRLGRIGVLRNELTKSIGALAENAAFVVLMFNDQTFILGGQLKWTDASDAYKRRAREQIDLLQASGGTEPLDAFNQVFKMRPKPDAIYFMTDGEFPGVYRENIRLLNARFRIPVHCICFASNGGEAVMRGIAQDSGGTYSFVPGPPS